VTNTNLVTDGQMTSGSATPWRPRQQEGLQIVTDVTEGFSYARSFDRYRDLHGPTQDLPRPGLELDPCLSSPAGQYTVSARVKLVSTGDNSEQSSICFTQGTECPQAKIIFTAADDTKKSFVFAGGLTTLTDGDFNMFNGSLVINDGEVPDDPVAVLFAFGGPTVEPPNYDYGASPPFPHVTILCDTRSL
jgi:hypothetical protein